MQPNDTSTDDRQRPRPQLKDGRVVGIAGPVIDVEFPRGSLPELNNALEFDVAVEGETHRRCSPRSPSSSATAGSAPSA